MEKDYRAVAAEWMGPEYDEATRKEVFDLFQGDGKELEDRFYRTLEFGTGGLRGVLGAGTNRMNRYTVSMATRSIRWRNSNSSVRLFSAASLPAISFSRTARGSDLV